MHTAVQPYGLDAILELAGDAGELVRSTDWSQTPLGPIREWSKSLRAAVGICVGSRFPIELFWGPGLPQIYNDAFIPILAEKHPQAMGLPGHEVWSEIWDTVGPMVEGVMATGKATWSPDLPLPIRRGGQIEEGYFTFSISPVLADDGSLGGVINTVHETTRRVLGERRLRTLRSLGEQTLGARRDDQVVEGARAALAENVADLPYTRLYLLSEDGCRAHLAGATGTADAHAPAAEDFALDAGDAMWPFARVAERQEPEVVAVPGGRAVVLALADPTRERTVGLIVVGVSPRRPLDDDYLGFLGLLAKRMETALAEARAYEAERRRADALAALDTSKTAFFTGVSHEFRTPLTLLLGPLADALSDAEEPLGVRQRERLETADRNAQRLLKLVNTLLDFSRIEAGRVAAVFEPTELGILTAELASSFRAAAEREGLELRVDCSTGGEPAWVDRDMWEKIVLNLLSNAFKFTAEGHVALSLRPSGDCFELEVSDTGAGIAAGELPHLFERFHQVRGTRSRTSEGTGIGLALVDELVRLHHGKVDVRSTVGSGTTFTVSIPAGCAHLPADQLAGAGPHAGADSLAGTAAPAGTDPLTHTDPLTGTGRPLHASAAARAYVAEALPDTSQEPAGGRGPGGGRGHVLVADDNPDMRAYIARLLDPFCRVELVNDGTAALSAAIAHPPDLVLTDVMMPGLDGFGLLRALRQHPETSRTPVVMLSARAGSEATVEGLAAGADDYLIKPFAARELVARVMVHLELSRTRRQAADAGRRAETAQREWEEAAPFRALADTTSDLVSYADGAGRVLYCNPAGRAILGVGQSEDLTGTFIPEYVVPEAVEAFTRSWYPAVMRDGVWRGETTFRHRDGHTVPMSQVITALYGADGEIAFFATIARDITAERAAAERLEQSEERFRGAFDHAPNGVALVDLDGRFTRVNPALCDIALLSTSELLGTSISELVTPADRGRLNDWLHRLADGRVASGDQEAMLRRGDGSREWVALSIALVRRGDGTPGHFVLLIDDIGKRRRLEQQLRSLADHDALTGLLNRRRLEEELERHSARVRRYGAVGALLMLDLDNFKLVNDTFGHGAGDAVLRSVAAVLVSRLRADDIVARLGGDEFAILLPEADRHQAAELADQLVAMVREQVQAPGGGQHSAITTSIGIVMFGDDATEQDVLVGADAALYEAKGLGRCRAAFSSRARRLSEPRRLDWAERIRSALAEERFVIHLQPIQHTVDRATDRSELLLRMIDDGGDLIPPGLFLPTAERVGLSPEIDRWVVSQALDLLSVAGDHSRLHVNLSAQSVGDEDLYQLIRTGIEHNRIDPGDLTFELTETSALANMTQAEAYVERLRDLGCPVALDDFGAGFSSLYYLKHLKFDFVKIDADFVRGCLASRADRLIIEAAVGIARGLEIKTIAEGAEDDATTQLLEELGVDYVQGYWVGRPVALGASLSTDDRLAG